MSSTSSVSCEILLGGRVNCRLEAKISLGYKGVLEILSPFPILKYGGRYSDFQAEWDNTKTGGRCHAECVLIERPQTGSCGA